MLSIKNSIQIISYLLLINTALTAYIVTPMEEEREYRIQQISIPSDMRSSPDFSWFPDSQSIVIPLIQRFDKNDFRSVIAVIEVGSGKVEILTEPNIKHSNPVCSPDGKRIAYIGPMDEFSAVWTMDINGKSKAPLNNIRCWHKPVWSPDSKSLLFTERNNDVWIVNADGSELKKVTSGPGARSRPKWSPDGNLIAYVDTSESELRLMDANGNNQRVLAKLVSMTGYKPIGDSDDFYDWSPDGKSIVYAYRPIPREGKPITYNGGIYPYEIWIVNVDSSDKLCLTPEEISCGHPLWSPDNKYILFESAYKWSVSKISKIPNPHHKRNIWMLDLVEKKKRQLTNSGRIREYAISPDGKKIIFMTEDDTRIFIIDCSSPPLKQ